MPIQPNDDALGSLQGPARFDGAGATGQVLGERFELQGVLGSGGMFRHAWAAPAAELANCYGVDLPPPVEAAPPQGPGDEGCGIRGVRRAAPWLEV